MNEMRERKEKQMDGYTGRVDEWKKGRMERY